MKTQEKIDAIIENVEVFSMGRLRYNTPYSAIVNGKREWYKSLDEMYIKVVKNDRPIYDYYLIYKESCIKKGIDYPSYVSFLNMYGWGWILDFLRKSSIIPDGILPEYRIIAVDSNGMIIELEDGFTNYDQAVDVAKIYEKDYKGVNVEMY